MPEGKLVNDKYVMFGEPINKKVLKALQNNSPTASEILGSLPASVFEETEIRKQMQKEKEIQEALAKEKVEEEVKEEQTLSKRQLRLMKKQGIEVESEVQPEAVAEVQPEAKAPVRTPSTAGNILKNFIKG